MSEAEPLNILIVGAGIGGLTAGVAFRQAGHNVTLLESSKFSNEVGAAINVAPNCEGLLDRLGISLDKAGANKVESLAIYTISGKELYAVSVSEDTRWEHSWLLVHRARLHAAIKDKALAKEGNGKPCTLRLSSKVVNIDVQKAQVTLEDGELISGDVVIGADGVHSQCRKYLEGGLGYVPFDCGHSGYRFMVSMENIRNNPETKDYFTHPGRLLLSAGEDRRFITYPCDNNETLNCMLMHPSQESQSDGPGWNRKGDKNRMLQIGETFTSPYKALMQMAPEDTLKIWTLLDLPVLPEWRNDRMVLMGDAAHPFLPHQAQGGSQAVEDAVSLATVMPLGTRPTDVPDRLDLYITCRRERANKIQAMTRLSGKPFGEQVRQGYNPYTFTDYNFSHDEFYASRKALQRHLESLKSSRYHQPLSFGAAPGPEPLLDTITSPFTIANSTNDNLSAQFQIVHSIRFVTSGPYLQTLLPTAQFSFRLPDTRVQASFECRSFKNVAWLGGLDYEQCGLYIHGIEYTKKDGSKVNGSFLPILFNNLTDSATLGREELGAPNWGCDICITDSGSDRKISLAWKGAEFLQLDLLNLVEETHQNGIATRPSHSPPAKPEPDNGTLMYRYVPAVGEPGKVDAEYAIFDIYANSSEKQNSNPVAPSETSQSTALSNNKKVATDAKIKFDARDRKTLPTIHHIAVGLADIPVYEILEAKVEEIPYVNDLSGARRIE